MNLERIFVKHKLAQREKSFSSIPLGQYDVLISLARILLDAHKSNSKILAFGNGGSAAESQHFIAELVGRFRTNRAPLNAFSLNSDTAILTAVANDFGYEEVFTRQVKAHASKNDLVIGFSTSGKSASVTSALRAAIALDCKTVLFTGTNKLDENIENNAVIVRSPSRETAIIQEIHLSFIHILCEILDLMIQNEKLFETSIRSSLEKNYYQDVVEIEHLVKYLQDSLQLSVGFVNGCFDILHQGHLQLISQARKFVDVLVVAINSDESIKMIKGNSRPILNQKDRAGALIATGHVDYVVVFDDLTPIETIKRLKPMIIFKGSDYATVEMPERSIVESYGGVFKFIQAVPGISTSRIISICKQN